VDVLATDDFATGGAGCGVPPAKRFMALRTDCSCAEKKHDIFSFIFE
jgi:rubredoxin